MPCTIQESRDPRARSFWENFPDSTCAPTLAVQDGTEICLASKFWARATKTCTVTTKKQFEKAFTDFLDSVYDQAVGRDTNRLHTVDSYLKARRDNIGAYAAYMPAILGIEIADEAFYHPTVVYLADLVGDLLSLDNVSKPSLHRVDRGDSRFSTQLG